MDGQGEQLDHESGISQSQGLTTNIKVLGSRKQARDRRECNAAARRKNAVLEKRAESEARRLVSSVRMSA